MQKKGKTEYSEIQLRSPRNYVKALVNKCIKQQKFFLSSFTYYVLEFSAGYLGASMDLGPAWMETR